MSHIRLAGDDHQFLYREDLEGDGCEARAAGGQCGRVFAPCGSPASPAYIDNLEFSSGVLPSGKGEA